MDARQCAINYIKILTTDEKKRLKGMLSHSVICGLGYAKSHNVDVYMFNNELKRILGGTDEYL